MKRRKPQPHTSQPELVALAVVRLQEMLDDPSAAVRLAAIREILRRAGGRTTTTSTAPGQSSTDAALQAEDELSREGDA